MRYSTRTRYGLRFLINLAGRPAGSCVQLAEIAREEGVSVTPATFGMDAMTRGCLGGTGFCFISHVGQVQPCGYLTLDCGNVRTTPFPEIWRKSKPFLQFRDQSEYKGKCGVCEFHKVCGGCRARAWSMDGDYMGEEPLCTYQPRKAKEAE